MTLQSSSVNTDRKGKRRVLVIAAAYPPVGGSGVQRTVKFTKYLPSFNWLPTVWSCDVYDKLPYDETLLDDIPSEVVVHHHGGESYLQSARRMTQRVARAGGRCARLGAAIDWRLEKWLAQRPFPDSYITWAQSSVKPLLSLIERERIEVIYSTFSPASNHWLALKLKRSTGLPWLADFRDLWTEDFRYVEPSFTRRRDHRRIEQEIIEEADIVVGVTKRQTEILANHLPDYTDKFLTITNGYDPDDFDNVTKLDCDNRFVIAHVGRLDRWRTDDTLFEGLKRFIDNLGDQQAKVVLRIVGHVNQATLARIVSTGIACEHTGYVSHKKAISEMIRSNTLLLVTPNGPNATSVIPAKLFEYLAARRPIVLVGPSDGICEPIVNTCAQGYIASFNADQIAACFMQCFDVWRKGANEPLPQLPLIDAYSRVTLTSKLSDCFDQLVATPSSLGVETAPMEVGVS